RTRDRCSVHERFAQASHVHEVGARHRYAVTLAHVVDADQAFRIRKRQRLQQDSIDDTEDCAVRSDPKRERQYCNGGESGTLQEAANGILKVLTKDLHKCKSARCVPSRNRSYSTTYASKPRRRCSPSNREIPQ